MPSLTLRIIVASTSGHTDYVVDKLMEYLHAQMTLDIVKQRAELANANDLLKGDVLILAASTWNTGGPEGQLNPHMHYLLHDRAAAVDLKGKRVAVIGLGDDRYFFRVNAKHLMEEYVTSHGGILLEPSLAIVNEPYGQEKKIASWAKQFLAASHTLHTSHRMSS